MLKCKDKNQVLWERLTSPAPFMALKKWNHKFTQETMTAIYLFRHSVCNRCNTNHKGAHRFCKTGSNIYIYTPFFSLKLIIYWELVQKEEFYLLSTPFICIKWGVFFKLKTHFHRRNPELVMNDQNVSEVMT
jgi:hypothetical protein